MWGYVISISFAIWMAGTWQACGALCGSINCTDNTDCNNGYGCLPSRSGSRNVCRYCTCGDPTQCYTDATDRDVKCNCTGSEFDGPYCTCGKCKGSCPPGYTRFKGTCNCYAGFLTSITWVGAKGACASMKSHLVKITSFEENEFIRELLETLAANNTFQRFWIGANAIVADGDWRWDIDKTDVFALYTNWIEGNPSNHNGDEKCGEMFVNGIWNGEWNDVFCGNFYNYACEFYP